MPFNCTQITSREWTTKRSPNGQKNSNSYADSLVTEPISPPPHTPNMSSDPQQDCQCSLKALNDRYDQYLSSLPQKQREYHELVMRAAHSANYPYKLSAPLLLAKQQQMLIENQRFVRAHQVSHHPGPGGQWPALQQHPQQQGVSSQHRSGHVTTAQVGPPFRAAHTPNTPCHSHSHHTCVNSRVVNSRPLAQITPISVSTTSSSPFSGQSLVRQRPAVGPIVATAPSVRQQQQHVHHNNTCVQTTVGAYITSSSSSRSLQTSSANTSQPHIRSSHSFTAQTRPRSQPRPQSRPQPTAPPIVDPNHTRTIIVSKDKPINLFKLSQLEKSLSTPTNNILSQVLSNPSTNAMTTTSMTSRIPEMHSMPRMSLPYISDPMTVRQMLERKPSALSATATAMSTGRPSITLGQIRPSVLTMTRPLQTLQPRPPQLLLHSADSLAPKWRPPVEGVANTRFDVNNNRVTDWSISSPRVQSIIVCNKTTIATPSVAVETPLNLKKPSPSPPPTPPVVVTESQVREIRVIDVSEDSDSDSGHALHISETPPIDEEVVVEDPIRDLNNLSETEFKSFVKNFVEKLCERAPSGGEGVSSPVIVSDDSSDEHREDRDVEEKKTTDVVTDNDFTEESDLLLALDLIKTRDLKRKPIAYLNAKYPLNEISRSIYAGVATKKAVMDFPPPFKRSLTDDEGVAGGGGGKRRRRRRLWGETEGAERWAGERDNWSLVLSHLDVSSPLSQKVIAVLPKFRFK